MRYLNNEGTGFSRIMSMEVHNEFLGMLEMYDASPIAEWWLHE